MNCFVSRIWCFLVFSHNAVCFIFHDLCQLTKSKSEIRKPVFAISLTITKLLAVRRNMCHLKTSSCRNLILFSAKMLNLSIEIYFSELVKLLECSWGSWCMGKWIWKLLIKSLCMYSGHWHGANSIESLAKSYLSL